MESPPRHYVALAFLPVVIAVVTLVALVVYQRGAEERRDRWQQPEAVLDAIGLEPGMRAAVLHPEDTYFLRKLVARVGESGSVYAVRPASRVAEAIGDSSLPVAVVAELPPGLEVLLLVSHVSAADQETDAVEKDLRQAGERLAAGARLGFIGVRGEAIERAITKEDVVTAAESQGFRLLRSEDFVDRQFLLVLETK